MTSTRSIIALPAMAAIPALLSLLYPATALAQTPPPAIATGQTTLEEVVVTAQKREENLQTVPIAIAAIPPSSLDMSGITDTAGLQAAVPGLVFGQIIGTGQPYLRGVGNESLSLGADSSVTVYVDEVYMARTGAAAQELFDVERVEVLKGPQGTLFGRNTVGGSINILNHRATDTLEGYADVSAGNYNYGKGRVAVNVPLSDKFFIRAAVIAAKRDGMFTNLSSNAYSPVSPEATYEMPQTYGAMNLNAGRVAMRWLISDRTEMNLSLDASDDRSLRSANPHSMKEYASPAVDFCRGAPWPCPTDEGATPGRQTDDLYKNYLNILPREQTKQSGASLRLTSDLGAVRLTSITGYRHYWHDDMFDLDGTDYNDGTQRDQMDSNTFTEEVQLASPKAGERLDWVTGLYFMSDDAEQHINPILANGAQNIDFKSHLKTTAWAAFAEGTYSATDALRLTLGARYSSEKKDITVDHHIRVFNSDPIPITQAQSSKTWTSFTPKIGLDWIFSPQAMAYMSVQKGFKSGGYNTLSTDPTTYEFDPEKITAYEIGAKTTLADSRLRLNGSIFYYDYKDIQESIYDSSAVVITNAATATVKGADLDITYLPIGTLELKLAVAYLDAKFDEYLTVDPDNVDAGFQDLKGNSLPRAPKLSYTASANLTQSLGESKELTWFLEYARTDDLFHSVFNQPHIGQEAYGLLNARITAATTDGRYSVSLWGKNLTDEEWIQVSIRNTAFAGAIGFPADKRTFGVTFATRW